MIRKLPYKFDVAPLVEQLSESPELWGEIPLRTSGDSPHRESKDIWLRFAKDLGAFNFPHSSIWYPAAGDLLSAADLCMYMMSMVNGHTLGGVLITKIPAGKQIYPHIDKGWHAQYYEKFAIQIASAHGQSFCFEGEELNVAPGESFWFSNQSSHWVINPTNEDRITLIMCIKR